MHRGYVNLWRKTIDSQFFSMGLKHIGLFCYLLLRANWKTGWFMGEEIHPGQMATSITKLADTLGEHRHTVKRLLNDLSNQSMITHQPKSNRWTLITICNWELYQNPKNWKNPTVVQPKSNQSPTACQPSASSLPQSNHCNQGDQGNQVINTPPKGGKKSTRFKPPTVQEVRAYCTERKNRIDAEQFVDYYQSKGWLVGKTPMKDWKAAARNWARNQHNSQPHPEDVREKQKEEQAAEAQRMAEVLRKQGVTLPDLTPPKEAR